MPDDRKGGAPGGPSSATLVRWSGGALVAAGVLMSLAVVLHPSQETPATIIENEATLVASHGLSTASYLLVLLGLPVLYGTESVPMGRHGMVGFLGSFVGTALLAVSGNFGFLAPVLATEAPRTIDALTFYAPVVGLNALAVLGFMVGFALFGTAMSRTATLPRPAGILVAVGAPMQLVGFAVAQLAAPVLWPLAVLGTVLLGAGLAWPGYRMWQVRAVQGRDG